VYVYVKRDEPERFLKSIRSYRRLDFGKRSVLYESDSLWGGRIPEAEKITITIITDNYTETTRPSYKIANRYTAGNLYAEHGLSCHIETVVDGRSHSLLFDFGRTFQAVSPNIDTLKIDFDKLEALALSQAIRTTGETLLESSSLGGKRYRKAFPCMWERKPSPRGDRVNGWPIVPPKKRI
jgi:hypothetical protein